MTQPETFIALELCTHTMAQPAATSTTGTTTFPVTPGTGIPAATPVVVDIREIMDRAQKLSIAVSEIGENHARHMEMVSLTVDVVGNEYYDYLHRMTITSLQRIQANLRVTHRQMTAYADAMGPTETEFHQARANAAAAIELADIYLSPAPIPQLVLQPMDMQHGDITPPNDTLDVPRRPSTPVQENTTSTDAAAALLTDEAVDDSSKMQVDEDAIDTFLQINLRQDEREQIDRLLEEPMEQPIDPPTSNHDPRDGSFASAPGPTLPLLGPGDVEVTVETSVGPEVPSEEVVENKTVRVDNVELPPEVPGPQVVCQGCKRVGHIASSCPLTNCQQWKLEKWTEQGNDRLSTSSDESAQSLPTPPAESAPMPILRPLAPGHPTPTPVATRTDGKAAAKPLQPAETSSTKQL